jgi:hypothetical protein
MHGGQHAAGQRSHHEKMEANEDAPLGIYGERQQLQSAAALCYAI